MSLWLQCHRDLNAWTGSHGGGLITASCMEGWVHLLSGLIWGGGGGLSSGMFGLDRPLTRDLWCNVCVTWRIFFFFTLAPSVTSLMFCWQDQQKEKTIFFINVLKCPHFLIVLNAFVSSWGEYSRRCCFFLFVPSLRALQPDVTLQLYRLSPFPKPARTDVFTMP